MKWRAVLLVILVLSTVVSVYFLVRAEGLPTDVATTVPALSGTAVTAYTYNASLLPNLLFNTTHVGPQQGDLFPTLVLLINFSYTFTLNLSPAASAFVIADEYLVATSDYWNYTIVPSHGGTTKYVDTSLVIVHADLLMNMTTTRQAFSEILNQTSFPQGPIQIRYGSNVFYDVTGGGTSVGHVAASSFDLTYTPTLLVPGNRTFSTSWTFNTTAIVPNTAASTDVDLAIGLTGALVVATGTTVYFEVRPPRRSAGPKDAEAELRAVIGPFRDAVAETLSLPHKENIVVMRGWMDVVRAADMLGKPILHLKGKVEGSVRHIFYVVDGAVQYVYLHRPKPAVVAGTPPPRPRAPSDASLPRRRTGAEPPPGALHGPGPRPDPSRSR